MKVSLLYHIALLLYTISFTSASSPPRIWSSTLREQVVKLADLAAGAYSEAGSLNSLSGKDKCIAKHGGVLFGSFSKNCDSYGNSCLADVIVIHGEQEIVIAFRGTTAFTQLLTQAIFFSGANMTPFYGGSYGMVNGHYHNIVTDLWPEIEPVFKRYSSYNVTFTGHSMGGSLAAMAAFRFAILCEKNTKPYYNRFRKDQIQVHTFGAPRHGNPQHVRLYNYHVPHSVRYVNKDDGIAHYPRCKKRDSSGSEYCDPDNADEYVHEGVERWFHEGMAPDKSPIMCNGPTTAYLEDPHCSNTITVNWIGFHFNRIKAHIRNHRSYFEHWMFYYGTVGCDQADYNSLRRQMTSAEEKKNQ